MVVLCSEPPTFFSVLVVEPSTHWNISTLRTSRGLSAVNPNCSNRIFAGALDHFYSKALAAEAIGGVISSAVCAGKINRFRDSVSALILFLFGTGSVLLLEPVLARTGELFLCLAPFALFGFLLTAFNIQFMSYVQIAVDENYLGRVFSIVFTVAVLFMPLGSFLFSAVLDAGNVDSFYIVGGGIVLLSLLSMLVRFLLKTKVSKR